MATISVSGGILAGGENRRMDGFPKGCLPLGESTFLERIANVVRDCFGTVYLSVHGDPAYEVPNFVSPVHDRFPDRRASMNGVYSLLSHRRTPVLVVPWDMPRVNRDLLEVLLNAWEDPSTDADGVFFRRDGALQPLPGLYGLDCLSGLRRCMVNGDYCLRRFLEDRDPLVLPHESYSNLPDLTNVNTPEEYARLNAG